MQVLLADLHEDRAAGMQEFPREAQTIAQIGQVGVDAELPRVSERADNLRLARQITIATVTNIPLVNERLEVRSVSHAIRWVAVDHLDLLSATLLPEHRLHH